MPTLKEYDVVLIGSGIMSATLGILLNQLDPFLKIAIIEKLPAVAQESSDGWNNAGTGHASWCELNYTPEDSNHKICIDKACHINESFEITLQFWSYLLKKGVLPDSTQFINPTPHLSLVIGDDVNYLRKRYETIKPHHLFTDMQYSEDFNEIKQWIPLLMAGRNKQQNIAATRLNYGTDVDFGTISRAMIDYLKSQQNIELLLNHRVDDLHQDRQWTIDVSHVEQRSLQQNEHANANKLKLTSRFVFIGAGGGALPLLQKSGIPQSKDFAGFPVSGQFLVCKKPEIVSQHQAKVYGKAPIGAPPMSVPHLDTRIINGEKALLFGPFAGFTTKFLKHGSIFDLLKSVTPNNILPMLATTWDSLPLIRYLISEVLQSHHSRMERLRKYYPNAKDEDWQLITAGQRVQIIKKYNKFNGRLQFGTEVVYADDASLSVLLGASPGASTSVETMIDIIETCFKEQMQTTDWQQKMKQMIPSYQESLKDNPDLLKKIRNENLKTLNLI